jgi:alginate O-acetyltransferase complex protein AlgI
MGFSTNTFLFIFLVGTLGLYIPVRIVWPKLGTVVLLAASLIFYSWMDVTALPVLGVIILMNYLAGILIGILRKEKKVAAGIALAAIIIFNVALLIYFKYAKFILGISFMSLSAISYQVDIFRNKVNAQKNPLTFALYLAFFVKIVEGPIARYTDMEAQLKLPALSTERFAEGVRRFSVGLGKKVLLADQIGVIAHDILSLTNTSPALSWLGIISFTMQLYLDFSGHTDMAIGLGKMFGFDFKENFNNPYTSTSLTEFWRRWHMTLSHWLRDYIYIPIGGSRTGITYVNLMVTFLIAGFWHGATWNYIVWGAWNGLILCIERFFMKHSKIRLPEFLKHLITLFVIVIGWVFFYFEDLNAGMAFLPTLFGMGTTGVSGFTLRWFLSERNVVVLFISALACTSLFDFLGEKMREKRIWDICYLGILAVSILIVMSSTFQTFLYFKY